MSDVYVFLFCCFCWHIWLFGGKGQRLPALAHGQVHQGGVRAEDQGGPLHRPPLGAHGLEDAGVVAVARRADGEREVRRKAA